MYSQHGASRACQRFQLSLQHYKEMVIIKNPYSKGRRHTNPTRAGVQYDLIT